MFKKIFASIAIFAMLWSAFSPVMSYAEGEKAVKFEVLAPTTAVAGEAIDVTVRALTADNQVATGYRGSIVFITGYLGDTLPSPGKPVEFTEEDAGEKKFSKGVIFKRPGANQKIIVTDWIDTGLIGEVSITVEPGSGTSNPTQQEIKIVTPENDSKIAGDTVTISGQTRKNSKVSIKLNNKDMGTVVSDNAGIFTKEISGIDQENNILVASLLDASNASIGTSPEVRFSKSSNSSSFYGITVSPNTTVEAGSKITLTVEAPKGLSEVKASLDETYMVLKEGADGKYSIETVAPNTPAEYPIGVMTKTVTGEETIKESVSKLTVIEKKADTVPSFKNIKTETQKSGKVVFTFEVENAPESLKNFKIMYGTGTAALDKEVVTHDAESIKKDNKYSWYIPDLAPANYTFKIYGQDENGMIEGLVSEPITQIIGVKSCTISNVGKIHVQTDSSKSILSWDPVKTATAYNVYKIDTDGKYILVKKVKEPKYTVFLAQGAVKYDNFAVKALCDDGTESQYFSNASKVQTGPEAIAIFVIVSGILGALILRKRYS